MSDDTKRSIAWISAAVVTAIVYGLYSADWTADWWASAILFLLVGAALHPILGVSIVWIEGGWDFDAVVVWASVLAGALGISLIVPDASTGLRVRAAVVCFFIALFCCWLDDEIRWRSTIRVKRFRNPSNGYEENVSQPWLWCLLLGPIYFAAKGIWGHAAISLLLAVLTSSFFLISWFIYPFFANAIVEKHYLRNGWVPASDTA